MRRWRCLGLLLGLLLGAACPAAPSAASAPPRWDPPVAIAPDLPSSWFPDVQTDESGTTRLVWGANLVGGIDESVHALTGAVMYAQLGPSGWTAPRDLQVMDAGIANRPLITTDGTYAHLLFRTGSLGAVRLFYARAPLTADLADARSWSEPRPFSDREAYYAQIAVLADGALVALYNDTFVAAAGMPATPTARPAPPAGTPEAATRQTVVFMRRSTDHGATWSFPARISQTPERVSRITLAGSPDGKRLVAAWDEGFDNLTGHGQPVGVGTTQSTDGGVTWEPQQEIRSPLGGIEQATIAFGDGGVLLAYRSSVQDLLLYRTRDAGAGRWSEERPIPGASARPYTGTLNFDKLALAADGDGRLLLAYVGADATAPKGLAVMVTTFAAGQWSPAARVAAPDGYPEYPRLSVVLGNRPQLVYFVRDKQFELGHYTIFAVSGQSDARARAPVAPPPVAVATRAVPTRAVPAIQLAPPRAIPTAVAPLQPGDAPLRTPQAEVAGPALGTLYATLLALGLLAPVIAACRWLQGARR